MAGSTRTSLNGRINIRINGEWHEFEVGRDLEPIEGLIRAEEHRAYWKPRRPRGILLAESNEDIKPE